MPGYIRIFVEAGDKTITCIYDPSQQSLWIDAVACTYGRKNTKDDRAIAFDIMASLYPRKIRTVLPSPHLPAVTTLLCTYQRAAKRIERAWRNTLITVIIDDDTI